MERLRHIREQTGYSQQDLADESGVSQHTISEIELGRRRPQGRTLRKLAKVLGVEVADLFGEAEYSLGEAPPSSQLTLNGALEEERRLQYLRTWESFIRQLSGRWHARIAEREELGLELEAAWADELGDLYLELGQVVGQGLLRGWDESTAPEREKNLMKSIAGALDYLGEVWQEASRRTQTQQDAERRKEREAEIRRATEEIQKRLAG